MKKKISIGIIVIAIIIAIYFLFAPTPVDKQRSRKTSEVKQTLELTKSKEEANAEQKKAEEEKARLQRMKAEYAVLQQERQKLQGQINDIRSRLFDLKLPAKQANDLNQKMKRAYILLQNPPMLGAFNDVEGIDDEIGKVKNAQQNMTEVSKQIAEAEKKSNK
jgi:biopolymer transport protein ExbB/TolQ